MVVKESIFWNLIRILWQRKKIFLISIFSVAVITFIITSLMPKTYKASLTFIVNEEKSGFNISSLISELPFDIGGIGSTNVDKYIALLNSRRIRDTIIDEFNLWEEYNVDYIEYVYKELDQNVDIIDNMDGTITINCYFKRYPKKAALMAQRFYDELYKVAVELQKEKSREYKEYLEKSLNETTHTLYQMEDSLKQFQINHKIIEFQSQAEFSFQALAELEAQNLQTQIEYDLLKRTVSPSNPQLKELEHRLDAIEKKKNELYKNGEDYIMAFEKMPANGLTYYRLYRDVTIQQEILKILLPIVQNARIEEKKQTVNLQIIDPPYIPQYKDKPKRLTYIIIITMLIGLIELFYFIILDAYKKNKNEIDTWISRG